MPDMKQFAQLAGVISVFAAAALLLAITMKAMLPSELAPAPFWAAIATAIIPSCIFYWKRVNRRPQNLDHKFESMPRAAMTSRKRPGVAFWATA